MIVIDASLAVKWYLKEAQTFEALDLLERQQRNITVPDIFLVEVMGVLVRRANIDKALRAEANASIERFKNLFAIGVIAVRQMGAPEIAHAATLAMNIGHPVKNCIYLVLAMDQRCDLLTCDARFAAKALHVWGQVRMLGE